MKKPVSFALAAALALSLLSGCGARAEGADAATGGGEEAAVIRLASLSGPTTMGLAKLIDDQAGGAAQGYELQSTVYGAADEITGLIAAGKVDVAAIPANLAANLYAKTDGGIEVVAINTLGVLYVVQNGGEPVSSVEDLRGRTVYSTGKGTTPEYVFNAVLGWNGLDPDVDVDIEYRSEAGEIASLLSERDGIVAVLPQPYIAAVAAKNEDLRTALDLTAEWESASGRTLVTGVTVVTRAFAETYPDVLARFCEDAAASAQYALQNPEQTAQLTAELGVVAKPEVALAALPYCNITFIEGEEMKRALSAYLEVLYNQNPASVGGELPDDGFYLCGD